METVELYLELWQVEAIAKDLAAANTSASFESFMAALPEEVANGIYQKWETEDRDKNDSDDDNQDEPEEDEYYFEFTNFLTGQTFQPQDWQRNLKVGDY